MKKGIVLLITLFFITTISLIILKSFDDTEEFFKQVDFDKVVMQSQLSFEDLQNEIIELFHKNKDDSEVIDGILELSSTPIPFEFHSILMNTQLQEYFPLDCNINKFITIENIEQFCTDDIVRNIEYPYELIQLINQLKPIDSEKKFNYLLQQYQLKTKDETIDLAKDSMQFINIENNESKRYIQANFDIEYSKIITNYKIIFEINSKNILYKKISIN